MDFAGKRVLVTGASRGIGFATAKEFLARGARVAVNGRTEQSVATAITELGGGDRLVAAPGNIGTVEGCESAVGTAIGGLGGLGGLDVIVNNAGVCIDSTIEKSDETIWDEPLLGPKTTGLERTVYPYGSSFRHGSVRPPMPANKSNAVGSDAEAITAAPVTRRTPGAFGTHGRVP